MGINRSALHETLDKVSINADNLTITELIDSKKELADLDRIEDDNDTRHHLTYWILSFNALWMLGVMTIVILKGLDVLKYNQSEIITLLTTTSANVLGFGYIVANYIYKQPVSSGSRRKQVKRAV